jgi:uncharacterized protein (DUF2147 family)
MTGWLSRKRRSLLGGMLLLTGLCAVAATPARASEPDPSALLGTWMAESQKVAIEIYRCDDELCGKVVWIISPYGKSGKFKRDKRNPDPSLRGRPYCGTEVIWGLRARNDNDWRGGKFYYIKKGQTFDLDIALKGENRLEFRGYLGLRLLGKTEIWTRPNPQIELACAADPDAG